MKHHSWLTAITALAAIGLASTASANTITPELVSTGPTWTYSAKLTSGEIHAGDGFTIFDFGGYVAGSITAPVNWTASTGAFGSPWGVAPGGPDTPDVNLTFTYTGPSFEVSVGAFVFIPFTAGTTSPLSVTDDWTSRDHLLAVAGVIDGGVGSPHTDEILVPAHVPDGGSAVALLGMALMGLEAARRKLGLVLS